MVRTRSRSKSTTVTKTKAKAAAVKSRQSKRKAKPVEQEELKATDDIDSDDSVLGELTSIQVNKTRKRDRTPMFTLDNLIAMSEKEKQQKQKFATKLQKLDDEMKDTTEMKRHRDEQQSIQQSIATMKEDEHLFGPELRNSDLTNETFGYVFQPMTAPLEPPTFNYITLYDTHSMHLLFKSLTAQDALGEILWGKLIILRLIAESNRLKQPVACPEEICSFLFQSMACHSDPHIIKGAFANLMFLLRRKQTLLLTSGLPGASFNELIMEGYRFQLEYPHIKIMMSWKPTLLDFLSVFRKYGFRENKRGMSAKNKMIPLKEAEKIGESKDIAFPSMNMEYVLTYLLLCLRTGFLEMEEYDYFSLIMFFFRMNFEKQVSTTCKELALLCVKELINCFTPTRWCDEWSPLICSRICGKKQGIFNSTFGWLAVSRSIPKTPRGLQLTAMVSVFVLQHHLMNAASETSPQPMKLPLQQEIIVDILMDVIKEIAAEVEAGKILAPMQYHNLCLKVSMIDLSLQPFTNKIDVATAELLISQLEAITQGTRKTMVAKWHEMKTIVSVMRRTYVSTCKQASGKVKGSDSIILDD